MKPLRRSPVHRAAWGLIAGLALLATGCGEEAPPPPVPTDGPYDTAGGPSKPLTAQGPRPHVLIVVFEQLRGDRCGGAVAGASQDLMPRLAALAERGDAFEHAVTPCPEPAAALASLLTGLSPARHGVTVADPRPRLDPEHVTLAEILAAAGGYATRVFVPLPSEARWPSYPSANLSGAQGLWQGFGERDVAALTNAPQALAAWRAGLPAGQPTCALLVASPCAMPYGRRNHRGVPPIPPLVSEARAPHEVAEELLLGHPDGLLRLGHEAAVRQAALAWLFGQRPEPPDPRLLERVRAAYDDGVAWADEQLGALLDAVGPDTLVVVTSTGGTGFCEHGVLGPGRDLHDEQVRIPLVFGGGTFLKGEGGWAKTASLVDVLPTLLDVLELPALPDASGVSLRRVLLGETRRGPVLSQESELPVNTGVASAKATQVSLRSLRWKYVVRFDVRAGTVVERAYDLDADPGESKDLAVEGLASDVGFDESFCEAVERVRDGLWLGSVAAANRLSGEAYSQGTPVVTDRPAPCRPK